MFELTITKLYRTEECNNVLDNVPLLLYILALKTLVLCLAFAGAKIYQSKKAEAALKQEMEMKRKLALQTQELIDDKKDD
uniref:Small integral membrane protein 11A n=1 Tax=Cyprinus carpio carpio TaxID=630221 RepID=A0A8C1AC81_CYPCA